MAITKTSTAAPSAPTPNRTTAPATAPAPTVTKPAQPRPASSAVSTFQAPQRPPVALPSAPSAPLAAGTAALPPAAAPAPDTKASTDLGTHDAQVLSGLMPPQREAELLSALKDHAGDKAYEAALVSNLPSSALINAYGLGTNVGSTPEERKLVTDALGSAREAGTMSDAELQQLGADINNVLQGDERADAVKRDFASIGVPDFSATKPTDDAVLQVQDARVALESAHAAADAKNAELARLLDNPGLTPEQKRSISDAFRADNAGVYAKEAEAAATLRGALESNRAALEADAENGGTSLTEGLGALAKSPEAEFAATELAGVLAKGGPVVTAAGGPKAVEELLGQAVQTTMANELAKNGGDAKAAAGTVERLLAGVMDASDALSPGYETLKTAVEGFERIGELLAGAPPATALKAMEEFAKSGPLAQSLAVVGLTQQVMSGVSEAARGEWAKAIGDFAGAGQNALTMAGALSLMAEAGAEAGRIGKGADIASRLIPGLGLLASGAGTVVDFQQLIESKNPGYAVAVAGDLVSFLGSLGNVVVPGNPVSEGVTLVGGMISTLGGAIAEGIERSRNFDEMVKYYQQAGVPADAAAALAGSPGFAQQLIDAGMTPEQIQKLAGSENARALGFGNGDQKTAVTLLQQAGLSTAQIAAALQQGTPEEVSNFVQFAMNADQGKSELEQRVAFQTLLRSLAPISAFAAAALK